MKLKSLTARLAALLCACGFAFSAWAETQVGTWADFVSAANSGGEIVLSGDITDIPVYGDSIELDNEQSVVLDLAGHTISVPADWFSSGFISIGDGVTFVIKGGGMIDASSRAEDDFFTLIDNYGTLTIKSGVTIKANAEANAYALSCGDDGTTIVENGVVLEGYVYPDGFTFANDKKTVVGNHTVSGGNVVVESSSSDPVVAKIGETEYTSLAAAISDVPANGTETTIVLQSDSTANSMLTIDSGKNVRIDLNGHDIVNAKTDDSAQQYALYNQGTLTIVDSTDNGTTGGHVYTVNSGCQGNAALVNDGTLVINGGWFGDADCDKTNANLVQCGNAVVNLGVATLNGGHYTAVDNFKVNDRYAYILTSQGDNAVMTVNNADMYGAMNGIFAATGGGEIVVNDGSFSLGRRVNPTGNIVYRLIYTTGTSKVTVKGGTWIADNANVTGEEDFKGFGTSQILLEGGTFTLQNGFPYASEGACGVSVSGGVYSKVVPAYCCAPDYTPVANTDSETSTAYPYTVASAYEAQIVRNNAVVAKYESLSAAIDAAQSGDTITLLGNVSLSSKVSLNKEGIYTIDGAGYTILMAKENSFDAEGAIIFGPAGTTTGNIADIPNKTYTLQNVTIKSFDSEILRIEGCGLTLDNVTFDQNYISTDHSTRGYHLVRIANANVSINDSTFSDNTVANTTKGRVIYVDETSQFTLSNCVFDSNTVNGSGVVTISNGSNHSVVNNTFKDNTVASVANGAVLYLSKTATVTGNLFKDNSVTESTAKEGVIVIGSGGTGSVINNNAFDGNTLGTSVSHYATIYTGANCDITGNYWGDGAAPEVEDHKDVYDSGTHTIANTTYATAYAVNDNSRGVTVTLYVPPVAQIGETKYQTLEAAIDAAQDGATIEILDGTWGAAEIGTVGKLANRAKSLTIQAAEGASPKFTADVSLGYDDSSTRSAAITVKGLAFKDATLLIGNYAQTTVQNCSFEGSSSNEKFAAALAIIDSCCSNYNRTDFVVDQVTISNCTFNGTEDGKPAVRVRDSGNVSITGNTVLNANHNGITFESNKTVNNNVAKTVVIQNNTITEWNAGNVAGGGRGIRASLGTLAAGSTVTVSGNVLGKVTLGEDEPDFMKITGAGSATVDLSGNDWNNMLLSEVLGNGAIYTCDAATTTLTSVITTRKEPVAQIGETKYETLQAALNAAESGDTVKLLADIAPTALQTVDGVTKYAVGITKSIVLDGNGKSISCAGSVLRGIGIKGDSADAKIDVVISNLTVNARTSEAKGIFTRGNLNSLTLSNVKIYSEGINYPQPLTISGNAQNNIPAVLIDGCYIESHPDCQNGYAIINYVPAAFTITNSEIKGWACLYAKGGAAGTTYDVKDSSLISKNLNPGDWNAFGTIVIEEQNVAVTVTDSVIDVSGTENDQTVANFSNYWGDTTGSSVTLGDGNTVSLKEDALITKGASNDGYSGGTISISGGRFDRPVATQYLADGYICVGPVDGWYTVVEGAYVAQIGDSLYEKLDDAISAAQDGDTVKLLADVALTEMLTVPAGKNITLDLAGSTVSSVDADNWISGDMLICVAYGATLTVDDSSELELGAIDADPDINEKVLGAIKMTNKGDDPTNGTATLVVRGGMIFGAYYGISGNGTRHGTSVTIEGGWVSVYDGEEGIGIYQPQNGTLVITGDAYIDGATAVYVKSGSVSISGEVQLWGLCDATDYSATGNGANPTGEALVIDNCGYPGGAPVVSITGGFFHGGGENDTLANAIGSYASGEGNEAIAGFVSGGRFYGRTVPAEFCADGYLPGTEADDEDSYSVRPANYVAQIVGGAKFESLDDAFAAANAGDTVTLLADITYPADRSVPVWGKPVNINLGGHTLTTNSEVGKDLPNNGYTAAAICFSIPAASAASITISNGKIVTAYGAGIYADDPGLTLTLSNLTIEAAKVGVQSTAEYSAAIRVTGGAKVIIESGSYSGAYAIAASNSGAVFEINGGTFAGREGSVFFSGSTDRVKSVTITDGTFNGGIVNPTQGTLSISGGYYSVKPGAEYVVEGKLCTTKPYTGNLYKVVDKATVTFAAGDGAPAGATVPASFDYPSGDGAEIKLSLPTYTFEDYTFGGWTYTVDDKTVNIGTTFPAGTTGDKALVGTWTKAAKIEVATDSTEPEKTVEVKVTEDWVKDNVTKAGEVATPEEIKASLEQTKANGLTGLENYVLGLNGEDPDAKLKVDSTQSDSETSMPVVNTVKQTVDTGFTVKYSLDKVDETGAVTQAGDQQETSDLDLNLAAATQESNSAYFKMTATITKKEGNTETEVKSVPSENTIGVMKVESQSKTTVIGVPWTSLSDDGSISVADIVRTSTLSEGDQIQVYDTEANGYRSWTLDDKGAWVADEVIGGGASTEQAQTVKIDRGKGVLLTRTGDKSKPIYLVGSADKKDVEVSTTLEKAPDEDTPAWNLVASPSVEPKTIEEVVGENTTDSVIVPTDEGPRNYTYKDGEWGYDGFDGEPEEIAPGIFAVKPKRITIDKTIPAGRGFWYLNKDKDSSTKKIIW